MGSTPIPCTSLTKENIMKQTKLILIQGNLLATYINRNQIAAVECEGKVTIQAVREIFKEQEFWVKAKN